MLRPVAAICASAWRTCHMPSGSSPAQGSSKTTICGLFTRARAKSTRRAWPVDRVWISRWASWTHPSSSMRSRATWRWRSVTVKRAGTPRLPKKPPNTMSIAGRCTAIWSCMLVDTTPITQRISAVTGRGLPQKSTGGSSR